MVSSISSILFHILDTTLPAWISSDAFVVMFSILIISIVISFVIKLFRH